MASNGLNQRAKKGKCRICQRVRCTDKYVHPVGVVAHGYATGYIWQCMDGIECVEAAKRKMQTSKSQLLRNTIHYTLYGFYE